MLLLILAAVAPAETAAAKYPQDALRCLASLKEPDGLLICPEHRYVEPLGGAVVFRGLAKYALHKLMYICVGFFL